MVVKSVNVRLTTRRSLAHEKELPEERFVGFAKKVCTLDSPTKRRYLDMHRDEGDDFMYRRMRNCQSDL